MSESSTARRYASALYGEAQERGLADAVAGDIESVSASLDASRELRLFFANPVIRRERKQEIVDRLFEAHVGDLVRRFLRLMIEKGRESLVTDVARAYRVLCDQAEGVVEVRVSSALALADEERLELERSMARLTGKTVRLVVERDAKLLGGLVIRVGDTVYDGSVRRQLAVLRERMEHGSHLTN